MPDGFRQLNRLHDAVGKTIERIVDVDAKDEWIVVVFADGSYLPVEAEIPYEDAAARLNFEGLDPVRKVAAGIGSPEDIEWVADCQARAEADAAAREREQYLRLKKKFEFDEAAGRWKT